MERVTTVKEYKLVVLGGGAVGKSCLSVQLVSNHFCVFYDPTIEDSYRTQCEIDGRVALLDILDTAGQEDYSAMKDSYMRAGQGFVMVYSITSKTSFMDLMPLREHIYRVRDLDNSVRIPMTVCGNKADLESEREVTTKEGQDLAKIWKAEFYETSALTRQNVENAFHAVVRQIRATEDGKAAPRRKTKRICILM